MIYKDGTLIFDSSEKDKLIKSSFMYNRLFNLVNNNFTYIQASDKIRQ